MQYIFRIFTLLFALSLVGCGASIPKFKPYKMDIQQGNVVTSEMLLKLRPGMTKSQVKFIMGTPLLVDSFRTNRWDYFYQLRKDGVIVNQRRVILEFDNNLLARVRGDVVPKGQTVDDVKKQLEEEAKGKAETEEAPKPDEPIIAPIEEPDVKPAESNAAPAPSETTESTTEPVEEEAQTEEPASVIAVPVPVVPPVEPVQAESETPATDTATEQEAPEPPQMEAPKAEEPSTQEVENAKIVLPPVDRQSNQEIFRMDHQLDTDNIEPAQPEAEVSEPVVSNEVHESAVTEIDDEPLPPEEAPGFFERMLEKIGF